MGCGGDRDGYNGFVALKCKSTLSNILISFFLFSEETFRHLWQLSSVEKVSLSYNNYKRSEFILELFL